MFFDFQLPPCVHIITNEETGNVEVDLRPLGQIFNVEELKNLTAAVTQQPNREVVVIFLYGGRFLPLSPWCLLRAAIRSSPRAEGDWKIEATIRYCNSRWLFCDALLALRNEITPLIAEAKYDITVMYEAGDGVQVVAGHPKTPADKLHYKKVLNVLSTWTIQEPCEHRNTKGAVECQGDTDEVKTQPKKL